MKIYQKLVNGVRHLFGSKSGVPSENDPQVTYDPTLAQGWKFAYSKRRSQGGATLMVSTNEPRIPSQSDVETVAKCEGIDIINNEKIEGKVNITSDEHVTLTVKKGTASINDGDYVALGTSIKATATGKAGYTAALTVNGETVVSPYTFTLADDATIVATSTPVAEQ